LDRVVKVECHSGYTYPERPTAIVLDGRRLEIAQIISEARTPSGMYFRVKTADDRELDLEYDEEKDEWKNTNLRIVESTN
jgi:hypothetical protein